MSKRNENRPGYKETNVGWIPEEWGYKRLDQLCELVYGDSPKEIINPKGKFPVVGSSIKYRFGNKFNSEHSTVIIGRKGSIDTPTFYNEPIWVIDTAFFSSNHKKNDPKWLYYYLFFHRLARYNESTGVPSLSRSTLYSIRVPVPPLSEQRKIAEILSTWDMAIELVGKQIEAKQRLKKGLMQQLLTGKMRFPGFNDEWREVKLGELFTERNENDTSLDLLSITGDEGVIPRDEVGRKDTSNADKSKYKVIMPGDIGYNTMRMWQGRSAVSRLHGIVSPAYIIVTPKKNQDVDFYGYLFQLPKIIHLFYRYSQGLVSDTWSLKFPHFSQIKIRVPGYEEQKHISEILLQNDRVIEEIMKKIELLQKQKKGLMQKLLTGEVRVKV